MRLSLTLIVIISGISSASAQQGQETPPPSSEASRSDTRDYFDGRGRLIGTVTEIGGVTYFIGPDGSQLGTAEMVDGQRVFKSY